MTRLIVERRNDPKEKWPYTRFIVKKFAEHPGLDAIRLYRSTNIHHTPLKMDLIQRKDGKTERNKKGCALCSSAVKRRDTVTFCGTCMVPLCTLPIKHANTTSTCYEIWHTHLQLERSATRQKELLVNSAPTGNSPASSSGSPASSSGGRNTPTSNSRGSSTGTSHVLNNGKRSEPSDNEDLFGAILTRAQRRRITWARV